MISPPMVTVRAPEDILKKAQSRKLAMDKAAKHSYRTNLIALNKEMEEIMKNPYQLETANDLDSTT